MRYALIMAGGSGTRLWPMSRDGTAQTIDSLHQGKSLLGLAFDAFRGHAPRRAGATFVPANRTARRSPPRCRNWARSSSWASRWAAIRSTPWA